jgi:hypothetical protein
MFRFLTAPASSSMEMPSPVLPAPPTLIICPPTSYLLYSSSMSGLAA